MDHTARRSFAQQNPLTTWGQGRAVRLNDPVLYASDVPIHLIVCADAGQPFAEERVARMVCDSVERSAVLLGFRLYVYCLMPDHLHVLVSSATTETHVSEFLRKFKSFTTHQFQKMTGNPRLWQPSARDRVKRDGEELTRLVRYIADNPLRRGLVTCWTQWPYTRVFVDI